MKRSIISHFLVLIVVLIGCQDVDESQDDNDQLIPAPINLSFQIVNQFPHDTAAFTEGFTFYNGQLYESTGAPEVPSNNGTWVAALDLKTGKYEKKVDLGTTYFGEGITFLDDKMYQLTYKTQKGFVYDAKTFRKLKDFSYKSEGWGLTNDGKNLIMSTGTSNIYYLSPDTMSFIRMLPIQDNNGYVSNLNELEYIDGYIYVNHWLTDNILKINPATGFVVARIDLSKQAAEVKRKNPGAEEMNGIAYDSTTRKTYITGKKWPVIYEIKW